MIKPMQKTLDVYMISTHLNNRIWTSPAMTSIMYHGLGMALTSIAGTLATAVPYKSELGIFKNLTPGVRALAGASAYLLTLETVKCFVEESHPFWNGMTKAMPIVMLLAGNVFGQSLQEELVEPEILASKEYYKSLDSRSHMLRIAISSGLVAVISQSFMAYPVAGALGSLIGRHYIQDVAAEARELLKKIE